MFDDEEGGGGGGGIYTPEAKNYLFLLLDHFCSEDTEVGQQIVECIKQFGKATKGSIRYKYPYAGSEEKFRNQLLEIKGWNEAVSAMIRDRVGLIFIDKKIEDFNPRNDSYAFVTIDELFSDSGDLNRRIFHEYLKTITRVVNSEGDLIKFINKRQGNKEWNSLFDVVDLKPKFFGIGIDIKKLALLLKSSLNKNSGQ